MLSGLLDVPLTKRLQEENVNSWEVKDAGSDVLLADIEKQATYVFGAIKGFKVIWPLQEIRRKLSEHPRLTNDKALDESIFDDLLSRLFDGESSISLFGLGNKPINDVAEVIRRAPVFRIQRSGGGMGIIKFAPTDQVYAEYENYKRFVHNHLVLTYHAVYTMPVHFWSVGAIMANFIGHQDTPLPDFAQHYLSSKGNVNLVMNPLRHFFESVWSVHYKDSERITEGFYSYYCRCYPKLQSRIDLFGVQHTDSGDSIVKTVKFKSIKPNIKDPISFLCHSRNQIQIAARSSVTHGDLHCLNLLIDETSSFVIDFEFTSKGPRLRDFARLEVDIFYTFSCQ